MTQVIIVRTPMANTTEVIAIGNELGITLPEEMLARLNVGVRDILYLVEGTSALHLTPTRSLPPRWRQRVESCAKPRCSEAAGGMK